MNRLLVLLLVASAALAQIQVINPTDTVASGPAKLNANFTFLNNSKVAIFSGVGVPASVPTSVRGDIYINTSANTAYECFAASACSTVTTGNWQQILVGTASKAQLPATTVYTDQANTFGAFLQQFQSGANFQLSDPSDTTKLARFDLSNIGTGQTRTVTIPNNASVTVQPDTGAANNYISAISSLGVITKSQPSFSNLTGSISIGQSPLTTRGDILVANSTPALARLAVGASGTVLHGGSDPAYSAVVNGDFSGLLGLAHGGLNIDLTATGGASQVLKQTSSGGAITVARLACADLSDAVSTCNSLAGATFTSTININPAAASTTNALTMTQSGPTSGNQNANVNYNYAHMTGEATNSGSASNIISFWNFDFHTGGSNASGQRSAIQANMTLDSPSSATNANNSYVALEGVCTLLSSDNGTNTGAGAKGACYGQHLVAQSGATNLFELVGSEADINLVTGGSVRYRFGYNPVGAGNLRASGLDAAFIVGSSTTSWGNGLIFGDQNGGAPLVSTGCAICTSGTVGTIATGMDFSAFTIGGNFLKGPSGFLVTGTGYTNSVHYTTTGSAPTCTSTALDTGNCTLQSGSTDSAGAITLNPSGSPGGNGVATLTFNAALGASKARCVFTYEAGSGGWATNVSPLLIGSITNAAVPVTWNNNTVLTPGSSYLISYVCVGN